jgi:hypothetical protein
MCQIMCHAQQVLVDGLSMSYSMKHVCSDMRCFVIFACDFHEHDTSHTYYPSDWVASH